MREHWPEAMKFTLHCGMEFRALIVCCCVSVLSACGGNGKAETAPPAVTAGTAAPDAAATPVAPEPPAVSTTAPSACVAWSATERPNAPKQGTCVGTVTSIQQGDCGHYVSVKDDAAHEAVFICWEPCEVLNDANPPAWEGKRMKVQWKIGKLAVAGHEQCNNDAAALVTDLAAAP